MEYQHLNGDAASLQRAVQVLGRYQVAILQHEYGIFGGPDGEEVLGLMAGLQIPTIVTLHTVLSNPTPRQKEILEGIVALSGRTVVMSYTAMMRLTDRYAVDPHKVQMVPHGASMGLAGAAFRAAGGGPGREGVGGALFGPTGMLKTTSFPSNGNRSAWSLMPALFSMNAKGDC